jgi:DNA-binding response OmpR family regulator
MHIASNANDSVRSAPLWTTASLVVLGDQLNEPLRVDMLTRIRAANLIVPVLVYGGHPASALVLLDLGADSYVDAGTPLDTFIAQARALVRRFALSRSSQFAPLTVETVWRYGCLEILPTSRVVRVRGVQVRMPSTQLDVLLELAKPPHDVLDRATSRWHLQYKSNALDRAVCRIRDTLSKFNVPRGVIQSVRGEGYRLDVSCLQFRND